MADIAIKPSVSIIDHLSLKESKKDRLHLAIELRFDSLVYTVVEKEKNVTLALEEYIFAETGNFLSAMSEIKDIVENAALLSEWKSSCSIAINHHFVTMIPNPVFNAEMMKQYLSLNFELNHDDTILVDDLTNIKAKNVFTFPKKIMAFFQKQFGNVSFHHFSTSLIEPFALKNKNNDEPIVIINVQRNDFQLMVFQNKSLRLYNSFRYQNEEDFVYFTLFTFEQLKIDAGKTEVRISGHIEKNDALFKKLNIYIGNLKFVNYQHGLQISGSKTLSGHSFFSLFNQFQCVS